MHMNSEMSLMFEYLIIFRLKSLVKQKNRFSGCITENIMVLPTMYLKMLHENLMSYYMSNCFKPMSRHYISPSPLS